MISRLHFWILSLLRRRERDTPFRGAIREFLAFGYKEAISCIFPVFIFSLLALSHFITIPGLARYDFLLIMCLLMQYAMYRGGLESKHELYVICLFHLLGVSMEIFKVSYGRWSYPEDGYSKVFGVPLYSGFMYASVASYICQAWRNFDLKIEFWPKLNESAAVAALIYGNFYSNVYIYDLRVIIIPILLIAFRNTWVSFDSNGTRRRMPMMVSFFLIAFFIWLAENICTFLGAWRYPHQGDGWSMVRLQIVSSWFLLVIVSVIIVAALKIIKGEKITSDGTRSDMPIA